MISLNKNSHQSIFEKYNKNLSFLHLVSEIPKDVRLNLSVCWFSIISATNDTIKFEKTILDLRKQL